MVQQVNSDLATQKFLYINPKNKIPTARESGWNHFNFMPTINKNKNTYPSSYKKSDKAALRKKLYNDTKYRKIRDWYMMEHPLCEECLKEGKVTPSTQYHHIKSPFADGLTWSERYALLRDENNARSLCVYHHECAHGNVKRPM